MWRQIALPVIVVALSWLAVSGSTNFYLQWLDESYQRVFDENIASMHAASQLQQEVWHLHAEFVAGWNRNDNWSSQLEAFDRELQRPLQTLVDRAISAEERAVVQELSGLTRNYHDQVQAILLPAVRQATDSTAAQDRLFELARQISEKADRLRQINDDLLHAHNERRTQISQVVLWARSLAITLVPALGIALGWWTATRMQRSVARIQVSLHDPLLETPGDLGTVQVRGGNELASIQKQVEVVVSRLRRTGEELQAARQEVLRTERLAAIGGLAAGVAHEIRNPLTSVKLLLQHAASRGGDAVVAASRMGLILDEIERMETTIQGLLDFSRPAQPQRKLHYVRETLQRALHLVEGRAEKQHVKMELSLGSEPMLINGDPQQLHQVFVNLLINAIEAMPSGGQLRVRLSRDPTEQQMTVAITDTGVGIPSELLPRLFEPFASAKERGTGLGLAVSRRIVEEHGGEIRVRPPSPQGTTFEVILPMARQPALSTIGSV
jgi:two-component system, NtrC family, sensor histidine kinase HydH